MAVYDVVYLSPHPDDAVFSCGGRIWHECAAGRAVLVVTVAAGDPPEPAAAFARRLERRAGLAADATEVRREEDRRAVATLGAALVQWDLPDAVYRRAGKGGEPLYPNGRRLFGAVDPRDGELEAELRRHLTELPAFDELRVPLAIGGHVDHVLVRRAAEARHPDRLSYWEDFPYAARWRYARVGGRKGDGWRPDVLPLSAAALTARCAAMATYTSQVGPLFGDPRRMRRSVERQVARTGGERLWRPRHPPASLGRGPDRRGGRAGSVE